MTITTEDILKLKKISPKKPILPVLQERFSPRMLSSEHIPDEDIACFFEAARWAPSSYNRQPWYFYYAKQGSENFKKLASCLSDANQQWAPVSPILILACYISRDEKGENHSAQYDLGQAVMSLSIQAHSMGYYAHQIGGFDSAKAKELLQIADPLVPHVMVTVSKIGDYTKANEYIITRDNKGRERKEGVVEEI